MGSFEEQPRVYRSTAVKSESQEEQLGQGKQSRNYFLPSVPWEPHLWLEEQRDPSPKSQRDKEIFLQRSGPAGSDKADPQKTPQTHSVRHVRHSAILNLLIQEKTIPTPEQCETCAHGCLTTAACSCASSGTRGQRSARGSWHGVRGSRGWGMQALSSRLIAHPPAKEICFVLPLWSQGKESPGRGQVLNPSSQAPNSFSQGGVQAGLLRSVLPHSLGLVE